MVAVIAGPGLGLERSSASILGGSGQLGSAGVGRANDNVYVNAANGDLIIQNTDEMLFGIGSDDIISRTYNSQGQITDNNGLLWSEGVSRSVTGLSGTVNTANSKINRVAEDGAVVTYTYNTGGAYAGKYVSKEGTGAYDTLTFAGTTWTWTDGSTRTVELYDDANSGRITSSTQPDGNALTFTYDTTGLLTQVTTKTSAHTEFTTLSYNTSNRLTKVTTSYWNAATGKTATLTRVHYAYDTSGRLTKVNATAAGKTYVVTYGYDGTSSRIASITQTDGSSLKIGYTVVGGVYQVASLTQTASTGVTRTTSFSYDTGTNTTSVTDALGNVTKLSYDASGQLLKIVAPAAVAGAPQQTTAFAYYADGNVQSVIDPLGNTTTYTYDGSGNRVSEVDALGNTVTRTFGANNQLLTETHYLTPGTSGTALTTRYAYNSTNHLRFVVTPEGRVTEYRYNALGQQTSVINYTANLYVTPGSISETALNNWVSGIGDLSTTQRTDTTYDFRGNVSTVTSYGAVLSNGAGDTTAGTYSQTTYVYDQSGKLLSRQPAGSPAEVYTYDGIGRLMSSTDFAGNTTSTAFQDSASTTVVTLANGLTETSVYDLAGELISYTEAGSLTTTATTTYKYDADGRLMMQTDPMGQKTYYLYDKAGRKVANVLADGTISETVYNADNEAVETIQYKNRLTSGQLNSLANATATSPVTLASVRPAGDANDRYSWSVYDGSQRLIESIDPTGAVSVYAYDSDSRLVSTTRYANVLASVAAFYTAPPTTLVLPIADPISDQVTRSFYDNDGRLVGSLDGAGYLTKFAYDGVGEKIQTVRFANSVNSADRAAGSFAQLLADVSTNASDEITSFAYDAEGQLRFTVDATAVPTEYVYDTLGNLLHTTQYGGAIATAPTYSLSYIQGQISSLGLANLAATRTTRMVYDADNRLAVTINAESDVTIYTRDSVGNVVKTRQLVSRYTTSGDQSLATLATWWSTNLGANDRINRTVYDEASRAIYTIDAEGYVTQFDYNADGQVIRQTRYADVYMYDQGGPNYDTVRYMYQAAFGRLPDATGWTNWVSQLQGGATINDLGQAFAASTEFQSDTAGMTHVQLVDYLFLTALRRPAKQSEEASYAALLDGGDSVGDLLVQIAQLPELQKAPIWQDELANLISSTPPSAPATVTTYGYDAAGRLTDTVDPTGAQTHNVLDALGQITDSTLAFGTGDAATTHNVYDAAGRLSSQTHGYGALEASTTSYTYDGLGRVKTVTDGDGWISHYGYDALGRVLTASTPIDATTSAVTTYKYDAFGNKVEVIDPRSNAGFFYYDRLNRLILQVDPGGYATATTYSIGDQVTSVTRYDLRTSGTAGVGLPPTINTSANDATTAIGRDRLDRVISTTDALSFQESYTLDTFGDRLTDTNKAGGVITNTYDQRGLLLTQTLPQGITNPDGTLEAHSVTNAYVYDARGNRIQMIEAQGSAVQRTTNYVYDLADRLVQQTGDTVSVVGADLKTLTTVTPTQTTVYDRRGNIIETTDANGDQTFTYYDDLNRKIAEVNAVGTLSAWTYDADSNAVSARVYGDPVALPTTPGGTPPNPINPANYRETDYGYDRSNRQTSTTVQNLLVGSYNGSSYSTSTRDVVTGTTYDASGDVIQQMDGDGNSAFFYYDKLGRRIAQVDATGYLTFYTLDADGNVLTEEQFATPLAPGVSTASDPNALRSSVVGGANDRITTFTYDKNGQRLSETRWNVSSYTVSGSDAVTAGATTATVYYGYNSLGEVTRKTEATGEYTDYQYDSLGREWKAITSAFTDYTGASAQRITQYQYDGIGNVLNITTGDGLSSNRVTTYTYGSGGRLASTTDASGFIQHYYYDADGHVLKQSYSRLQSPGVSVSEAAAFTYDALGRTIAQDIADNVNGTWVPGDVYQTRYDAYGEVTAKGVNNGWQETFSYDAGGRLWSSNSGNGSTKLYVHDANGNTTLEVDSAGLDLSSYPSLSAALSALPINASNATLSPLIAPTINVYDGRNQLVAAKQMFRQINDPGQAASTPATIFATLTDQKTYDAFGEVVQEARTSDHPTSTSNQTTNFSYNTLGKLVQQQSPTVSATDDTGAVTSVTPTLTYYYDVSGRLIGARDANGNLNTRQLLAGTGYDGQDPTVVAEYHPDGGIIRQGVDVFGDIRTYTNALGYVESRTYNGMDRLTTVTTPTRADGTSLTTTYTYDGLGQRISSWNSLTGSGAATSTYYDGEGRVTKTADAAGHVTRYAYAWNGALATTGLAVYGGWTETTTNTAGLTSVSSTDYFGRDVGDTDFGGHGSTLTFDAAGRKVGLTVTNPSNGLIQTETSTFGYFNTGLLASETSQVTFGEVAYGNESNPEARETDGRYAYDAVGNRIYEETVVHISDPEVAADHGLTQGSYTWTDQNSVTTWDALNRMTSYTDSGEAGGNPVTITYEYDAAGNIRHALSTNRDLFANQIVTSDYWYKYDSMNRFVTTMGALTGVRGSGTISRGSTGTDITYDTAGERMSETTINHREDYAYTEDGYLKTALVDGALRAAYTTDNLGRTTNYVEYLGDGSTVNYSRLATYNSIAQVTNDTVQQRNSDGSYTTLLTHYDYTLDTNGQIWRLINGVYARGAFGTGGAYAGGMVTHTRTTDTSGHVTDEAETFYNWFGQAQKAWASDFQGSQTAFHIHTSNLHYDGSGALVGVDDDLGKTDYVNNLEGEVLASWHNVNSNTGQTVHHFNYYFSGVQLGDESDEGPGRSNIDYVTALAQRGSTQDTTLFQWGAPQSYNNFDESYQPINPTSPGMTATTYTVQAGDTLQSVALSVWGDASLWYLIADTNGLTGTGPLAAGSTLTIPDKVVNIHNSSSTFKVYDPNQANGNTDPLIPPTAQHNNGGCGVVGDIIAMVVATVVRIVLDVSLTPFLGPAADVVGSAASDAVRQGVEIAVGNQSKFNWSEVGQAALNAAVDQAAGIGPTPADGPSTAAGAAAEQSVFNQGIDTAVGLQHKFDWTSVATSSVEAGAISALAPPLERAFNVTPGPQGQLPYTPGGYAIAGLQSAAAAIAGASARSLITGQDFGQSLSQELPVVGSTIGQTIGNLIASGETQQPQGSYVKDGTDPIGDLIAQYAPPTPEELASGHWSTPLGDSGGPVTLTGGDLQLASSSSGTGSPQTQTGALAWLSKFGNQQGTQANLNIGLLKSGLPSDLTYIGSYWDANTQFLGVAALDQNNNIQVMFNGWYQTPSGGLANALSLSSTDAMDAVAFENQLSGQLANHNFDVLGYSRGGEEALAFGAAFLENPNTGRALGNIKSITTFGSVGQIASVNAVANYYGDYATGSPYDRFFGGTFVANTLSNLTQNYYFSNDWISGSGSYGRQYFGAENAQHELPAIPTPRGAPIDYAHSIFTYHSYFANTTRHFGVGT